MKPSKRAVQSLIGCAALALLSVSAASADAWDKKTNVTFREAVEFPGGTVVAPGKYVLKLLNSATDRHIVQVYDENQRHMYAMVMAIPARRLEPADKTILTFYETPRDRPAFIRTWFYPGDAVGQEFPYPKDRPYYVASTAAPPVPPLVRTPDSAAPGAQSTPSSAEQEEARPVLTQPANDPNGAKERAVSIQEAAPAQEPALLAQATRQDNPPARPAESQGGGATNVDQLPATASEAPYWAAGSIVLLAGAFLLRGARLLGR